MSMRQTLCEFVHGMTCEEVCQFVGGIVMCGDCKHMHTVRSWYSDNLVDECWLHADHENALGRYTTEPDGFCAWGERIEQ